MWKKSKWWKESESNAVWNTIINQTQSKSNYQSNKLLNNEAVRTNFQKIDNR